MVAKEIIKSDTRNKLHKMISGVVYSDPYVFITEFFQNSSRAKARRVNITLDRENGVLTFSDNGRGLKKIQDLLTLDYSSWQTTDEGFGIGFWSWLGFDIRDKDDKVYDVICEVEINI